MREALGGRTAIDALFGYRSPFTMPSLDFAAILWCAIPCQGLSAYLKFFMALADDWADFDGAGFFQDASFEWPFMGIDRKSINQNR